MKKIVVGYWREKGLVPYFDNNSEFEYSVEKQNEIINIIIESGFSVMVKPNFGVNKNILLIYISKDTFKQS